MAEVGNFVWRYARSNLLHSFAVWEVGERISVLAGFLIAAAFAALPLLGISAALEPTGLQQVAVGLGLWFLFLTLVVTPYRLWKEQAMQIANLQSKISGASDFLSRRKRLAQLDAKGVKIRNEGMKLTSLDEAERWSKKVSLWRKDAIAAIAAIDEVDGEEFKTLNKTEHAWRLEEPLSAKHEIDFRCHDERPYRLGELRKIYRVKGAA